MEILTNLFGFIQIHLCEFLSLALCWCIADEKEKELQE